jgi:hypothetical protein
MDDIVMPRTQIGANTYLVRPLLHAVGHYTVDSDRREHKSDSRERPEEQQIESLARGRVRAYLVHGASLRRRKLIAFEQELPSNATEAHRLDAFVSPNQNARWLQPVDQRHSGVQNLRGGLIHYGRGLPV